MRRMITNKQVVDVVNKAIEEGEIEVSGGGLPEIESGDAGKVLKVNAQEDGVEWGAEEIFVLQSSFTIKTASQSMSITAKQYEYLNTKHPIIKLIYDDNNEVLLTYQLQNNRYEGLLDVHTNSSSYALLKSNYTEYN